MRLSTNLARMFPGLGLATGIFGVYVFAEAVAHRLPAKTEVEAAAADAADAATAAAAAAAAAAAPSGGAA